MLPTTAASYEDDLDKLAATRRASHNGSYSTENEVRATEDDECGSKEHLLFDGIERP